MISIGILALLMLGTAPVWQGDVINFSQPPKGGQITAGNMIATDSLLVATGANWIPCFTPTLAPTIKTCTCSWLGTVGAGTGTLKIRDTTGSSDLCSNAAINCATADSTPFTWNCNAATTAAHVYCVQMSGCTTFPTNAACSCDQVQ